MDHRNALDGLQTLQHQTSHATQVLVFNGFEIHGPQANEEVREAFLNIYKNIDRLKQIVLLDAYDQDKVTVTS